MSSEKITSQRLAELGKIAEESSLNLVGYFIDGAPYTWNGIEADEFMMAAIIFFGGYEEIQKKVSLRKAEGEENADPGCSNWILWTALMAAGVDCENPS